MNIMKKLESLLHIVYCLKSVFEKKTEDEKDEKIQRSFTSTTRQFLNRFIRPLTHQESPKLDHEPALDDENEEEQEQEQEEEPPSPPPLSLSSLPTEIILLIFDNLPLPWQACLALTCKTLYEDLGYILQDERLSTPTAWASKTAEPPLSQPTLPRNQFLFSIEDDRWLYCSGCLKLHPRHLFNNWHRQSSRDQRLCWHRGAVLDVCPCLVLTYYDKELLEQWLRMRKPSEKMSKRVRSAFTPLTTTNDYDDSSTTRTLTLLHRCSITDHAYFSVDITIKALIGSSCSLELHSSHHVHLKFAGPTIDYFVRLYRDPMFIVPLEPIFICPHTDIVTLIFRRDSRFCSCCDANVEIPQWIDGDRNVIVQGVWYVGKGKFTSAGMCRHPWDKFYRLWYDRLT